MNTKGAFIVFLVAMVFSSIARNQGFIYLDDGNFYEGCKPFYPLMMNYSLMFEDSAGSFRITPPTNRCRFVEGCNTCGTNRQQYRNYIADHLRTIEAMGFNAVRIVGLALRYDDEEDDQGNFTGNLITGKYYEPGMTGKNQSPCPRQVEKGKPVTGIDDFKRLGDLFEQIFDIIREEGISLKVVLLTGSHGVEIRSGLYADYLGYLADRFSDEPILFAYDLYNEPVYQERINPNEFSKYDRANWFYEWCTSMKEKAPWHFVTYGPVLTDIYGWDPEVMPADFFAYHIYSTPREHQNWSYDSAFVGYRVNLKYVSENFSRPWILGETGLSGVDRHLYGNYKIHPIVRSEEDQQSFARNSLKYTKWYGARGYALWEFKDAIWSFKQLNKIIAKEFFMGVVNYQDNETWKPAAYEFSRFNPDDTCMDCIDPAPANYYNPEYFPYPYADGYVFTSPDKRGPPVPCKNAVINALLGKPGNKDFNHSCLTFTDAEGKFTIRKLYRDDDIVVKLIRISAPSMSCIYQENWGRGLKMDAPFYIYPLDPGMIPKVPVAEEKLILSRGKPVRWERKRVLQEGMLVIKNGARLVITDTLFIKPGGIIEVLEGGILELDRGVIAGLFEWEGINLYKSGRKNRIDGQIILKNGGTVRNALHGIRKFDAGGNVTEIMNEMKE